MLTKLVEYRDPTPAVAELPAPGSARRILHVAVHRGWSDQTGKDLNFNAGDTCLNPLVRLFIERAMGPVSWGLRQVWEPIDVPTMRRLQQEYDAVVVGGGGLFLPEQQGTDISTSGWTWNCTVDALEEVTKPMAVFAVGYNKFRNHVSFAPVFFRHVNKLASVSSFFGLRNSGSIAAVRDIIESERDKEKVRLQFCPTTMIWQLRPDMREAAEAHQRRQARVLVVNCAFDRVENRFPGGLAPTLQAIARSVAYAASQGFTVRVAAHKHIDRQIEPYLDAAGVNYQTHDLSPGSPDDVMRSYAQADLVLGLRGHAQMIPFGVRVPVISVISHNKLRFFLDDVGRPDWGVDVDQGDFEGRLRGTISRFIGSLDEIRADVAAVQEKLWQDTQPNFALVRRALGGA